MNQVPSRVYIFGDFCLDPSEGVLFRSGHPLHLTPKAFGALLLLVENAGHVVEKDEFMKRLWPETFVGDDTLAQNISLLRKAIGDGNGNRALIATVPRRGYRFAGSVHEELNRDESVTPAHAASTPSAGNSSQELADGQIRAFPGARNGQNADEDRDLNGRSSGARWARPRLDRVGFFVLVVGTGALAGLLTYALVSPPSVPKLVRISRIAALPSIPVNQNLATEGAHVYFMEREPGGWWKLHQVSAVGGEVQTMKPPFADLDIADISPNGAELLVRALTGGEQHPLWAVPVMGGPPRSLGIVAGAAGWSPAGDLLAYSRRNELFAAKVGDVDAHKIATLPGHVDDIRWSPSGSTIRFTVWDEVTESAAIWEASFAERSAHPLLPDWNPGSSQWSGNWTRDGRYYFFAVKRDNTSQIWALRDAPGLFRKHSLVPEQITAGPIDFYRPTPSTDGRKLFVIGAERAGQLLRYDARAAAFVSFLGGRSAEQLDFSRDGQWIAYISYPDDTLWRCRSDGAECVQLTFAPMHASDPHWSPDSRRIAFAARSSFTDKLSVYVLGLAGGKPELLLNDQRDSRAPYWSADGKAVALNLRAGNGLWSLAIYDTTDGQISLIPDSEGLIYPQYSPDGGFLAAQPVDNLGMALFNFATRQWRHLQVGRAERVCWSRAGGYLYWDSVGNGKTAIFRMRMSDFKTEPVAAAEFNSTGHPGPGLALAPDDSPLLLRDLSRRAIYAIDWMLR